MLNVRLPEKLEDRLNNLAEKTGRTKSFYAVKAIEDYLEDIEDYYLALAALEETKGKGVSLDDIIKDFSIKVED